MARKPRFYGFEIRPSVPSWIPADAIRLSGSQHRQANVVAVGRTKAEAVEALNAAGFYVKPGDLRVTETAWSPVEALINARLDEEPGAVYVWSHNGDGPVLSLAGRVAVHIGDLTMSNPFTSDPWTFEATP